MWPPPRPDTTVTGEPDGAPRCGSPARPHDAAPPRLFPAGWFCALHTPRARRGLPEIPPGPGWPPGNYLNRDLEHQEDTHDDCTRATEPGPDPA
ncbi:hypothetical protein EAO77_02710 [Streptomyces sp. t39]|nr:hypothetical protein EAO77_02710 [Streptomyces sp. t39]